jgi:hypothetical protein
MELREMALNLTVRIIADETHQAAGWELDDLLKQTEDALRADPSRGGHGRSKPTNISWLFLDDSHPEAGADLEIAVEYQEK